MTSATQKAQRLDELAAKVREGTYRVDSWSLARLLLVHPESREALGLPQMIAPRATRDFVRRAS